MISACTVQVAILLLAFGQGKRTTVLEKPDQRISSFRWLIVNSIVLPASHKGIFAAIHGTFVNCSTSILPMSVRFFWLTRPPPPPPPPPPPMTTPLEFKHPHTWPPQPRDAASLGAQPRAARQWPVPKGWLPTAIPVKPWTCLHLHDLRWSPRM